MLSDEEKILTKKLRYCEQEYEQNGYLSVGKFEAIKQAANLIEKQFKEIEELKAINKKLEARKYIVNAETGEISQIPIDNNYISKDKIIAKVIEIKNRPVKDEFITASQGKLNTIIDIENLLNEEE